MPHHYTCSKYDWSDLQKLYIDDGLTLTEIATRKNCSLYAVFYRMKQLNIPRRSCGSTRFGKLNSFYGKHHTEETKAKLRLTTFHHTKEAKARISKATSGQNNPMHGKAGFGGKKHKLETIEKMRVRYTPELRTIYSNTRKGENNGNWRGGTSLEPYNPDWYITVKQIRDRDSHICQLCSVPEIECFRALAVHHIDENKKNDNWDNLVSLCNSCHTLVTNSKDKKYWYVYFKEMISGRKREERRIRLL